MQIKQQYIWLICQKQIDHQQFKFQILFICYIHSDPLMKNIFLFFFISLVLFSVCQSKWTRTEHQYSVEVSKQIASGIKQKLLENIEQFQDQTFAKQLKADLNQPDDSKRQLKQIYNDSVEQIFQLFGIRNPGCDANKDGKVSGDELTCLNIIWKYFVPK